MIKPREIKKFVEQLSDEETAIVVISLWEKISVEIISIVGKDGFDALYVRSIFLTTPTFPWLSSGAIKTPDGDMVALLRKSFETQTPAQIRVANSLLLTTFADILSLLIGDQLTSRILSKAWEGIAIDLVRGNA